VWAAVGVAGALEGECSRLAHLEGQRLLALHCVVENSPVSEVTQSAVSSLYSLTTPLEARKVQGHCGKAARQTHVTLLTAGQRHESLLSKRHSNQGTLRTARACAYNHI
jgi:hypothetical protein